MGTEGTKLVLDHDTILITLKRHKGKISRACKDLNCCAHSLRKYIRRFPELEEALTAERNSLNEDFLDSAEDRILETIKQDADLAASLKAAMFTLNAKGEERGWKNTMSSSNVSISNLSDAELKQKIKQALIDAG